MNYIKICDDMKEYDDIKNMVIDFNSILTRNSSKKITDKILLDHSFELEIGVVKVHFNNCFFLDDFNLLPLFIFDRQLIDKMDDDKIQKIIELNPNELLDIFTYGKCLMDPYFILMDIFNVKRETIYQVFVLYLNKTISSSNEINQLNFNKIIKDFFINCNYELIWSKDIKILKKLISFYIMSKQIYPFMLEYQKYDCFFNNF